jgi:hypothetical protein
MKQGQQQSSILIRRVLISLSMLVERFVAKASGFVLPSNSADSSADVFRSTLYRGGNLIADPEVVLSFVKAEKGIHNNYSEFKQSHNVSGLIRESYQ